MKVGDMVRVRYRDDDHLFIGIIIETPDDGEGVMWKMWCGARETQHILAPHLDEIEVFSESR